MAKKTGSLPNTTGNPKIEKGDIRKAFQSIIETTVDAFIIVGEKGVIEQVNTAAERMFGYDAGSLCGKNVSTLIPLPHKELHDSYIQNYLETGQKKAPGKIVEQMGKRKNGTHFPVELSLNEMETPEGKKFLGVIRDITHRKQFEVELIKAKEDAEDSAKAKQEFLSNISHEIRTPMNSIMGMAEMLGKTGLSEKQKAYLETIQQSSENLLLIINDILDLSHIGSGKLRLEDTGFKMRDVVQLVKEQNSTKAGEKDIELLFLYKAKELNRIILGDPTRINQILSNLVNNAIKFTTKGKVELGIELQEETKDHIIYHFRVSDTGIGIPNYKIKEIFGDFTQADSSTTRKHGGIGLGLTISKRLVELFGGKLKVDSQVNKGSVFHFNLMFKKCNSDSCFENQLATHSEERNLNGMRILLVEDQEFNQLVVKSMTENWNCTLELATNGKEAIEKLSVSSYDVILMDIQMPVMDGLETTRFIRHHLIDTLKNIPIIALTAHNVKAENEKYFTYGMNDYVAKPFKNDQLYRKLHKYMNKQSPTEQNNPKPYSLKAIQKLSEGNREFVRKMLSSFISRSKEGLEEMKKHMAEDNREKLAITAHRIKPSFKYLSIHELYTLLLEFEKAPKEDKDISHYRELLKDFEKQLYNINRQLEKEL